MSSAFCDLQPKHRRIRRFEILFGILWLSLQYRK
jgi:hypothetical protein